MPKILSLLSLLVLACFLSIAASANEDEHAIERAILDYIESQHVPNADQMDQALHNELKKRTYWTRGDGAEFLLETDKNIMLEVARTYNEKGDRFPSSPRKEIHIFDIDGRTASAKLLADEWIDYLHLVKLDSGNWKIVNVLWQYHDQSQHRRN